MNEVKSKCLCDVENIDYKEERNVLLPGTSTSVVSVLRSQIYAQPGMVAGILHERHASSDKVFVAGLHWQTIIPPPPPTDESIFSNMVRNFFGH